MLRKNSSQKQSTRNRMLDPTQSKYIDLIKTNPVKIASWLGFSLLTELNNEWLKRLIFGREDWTLQAHRGSYKTTAVSLAFALFMILFPRKNIIFMRKTDTDVSEIINQTRKILESDVIKHITEKIYGKPVYLLTGNSSEITTTLFDTNRGTEQLLGIGIKGSLTGKHADWIHTDDIINLKDRISRAEREYTKQIYQELQNIRNRGGRITNTGTPWHKDDAFTLMPNITRVDCYESGLITTDQLELIRKSMSPSLFAANYELKHISSENALFSESPQFFSDASLLYGGQAHIDAGYGGEDGSAFTLGNRKGGKYYMLGKLKQKHIDECLDSFIAVKSLYRCGSISCEDNGDKGYLAKEIQKLGHPCVKYHESTNKYIKISSFLRREWTNISWHESTDPEYLQQILDYTEDAGHDDAPDSAASLIRKLESGLGYRGF